MENLKAQIKFLQEIEAKEVAEEATEQVRKIIKNAEEEAEKIRNEKMKDVSDRLYEKETSELELARLEEKKKISNVKLQILDEALAEAIKKLKRTSTDFSSAYKESLKKLIVEAATRMRGEEFEVLTNSRDREFIKERLTELKKEISKLKGKPVTIRVGGESLTTIGGVIVRDRDKKQIFNNTFEARLATFRQEMIGKIHTSLFEGTED